MDFIQQIVITLLTSGLITGIFALLTKRSRSPESQNELARLGNEFAAKLLEDARKEREELRITIDKLEGIKTQKDSELESKNQAIQNLTNILADKNRKIEELEFRRGVVARKLQMGEIITLRDIFGADAPDEIGLPVDEDTIVG